VNVIGSILSKSWLNRTSFVVVVCVGASYAASDQLNRDHCFNRVAVATTTAGLLTLPIFAEASRF